MQQRFDRSVVPSGDDAEVEHSPEAPEQTSEHEGSSLEELPEAIEEADEHKHHHDGKGRDGKSRGIALGAVIVLAVVAGIVFGAMSGAQDGAAAPETVDSPPPQADSATGTVLPVSPAGGAPVEGADLPPSSRVIPVGETTQVGAFTVTFGPTDSDSADRVEAGDATYHDELRDGEVLVTATVTVRNDGDHALDPAVDLLAGYLGGDGREYDMLRGPFCMAEDSLYDVGNLAAGASVTGTVCQGMPKEAVEGGVWVLRPATDYGQVAHFAAR
ncbi:hypothetical protein [Georgenia alba]|uniref:DUF4352 domain-containing protein n=1 Tax=Georgenia alba TaxID=2233858 RepID=A0ABW2Q937_9MICO